MLIRLDQWSTTNALPDGPFSLPETEAHLQGRVTGHPKHADGEAVLTTPICAFDGGREVVTESGSRYYLGTVDPRFRAWLRRHRPGWNWRRPIAVRPFEAAEPLSCAHCGDVMPAQHRCRCRL